MSKSQKVEIKYILSMPNPVNHLFEVEINFSNLTDIDKQFELIMPVWRSGRYLVFDFSSGVQEFEARNDEVILLDWKKTDKSTWQINLDTGRNLNVKYKVYSNEFNMRTRGLNPDHAFVNGT